jgi:hypothetical protein
MQTKVSNAAMPCVTVKRGGGSQINTPPVAISSSRTRRRDARKYKAPGRRCPRRANEIKEVSMGLRGSSGVRPARRRLVRRVRRVRPARPAPQERRASALRVLLVARVVQVPSELRVLRVQQARRVLQAPLERRVSALQVPLERRVSALQGLRVQPARQVRPVPRVPQA